MSILRKSCPACSAQFDVRKLFVSQRRTFLCSECGTRLSSGHWAWHLFASLTGVLFYSIPISLGARDHRWRYLAPVGVVVAYCWNYLFVVPRRADRV